MHILFLTDNFPPEVNAPASRTFEHCRRWTSLGHRVTVVTCVPNFPQGRVLAGYRNRLYQQEIIEGIRVIRVWTYISANEGFVKRSLDYMSFMLTGALAALFVRSVDIVIGTSPQFFTVCAAWAVAGLKRRPFVFELRDIWPESIRAVGALREGTVLRLLEGIELFLYRRAARIISVTYSFKNILAHRGIDPSKIDVITNGVDVTRFQPQKRDPELTAHFALKGKFVVGYIGTHGMAHALETLLEAAHLLQQGSLTDKYQFLFLGDGARKAEIMRKAEDLGLRNVCFINSVSKSEVARYWSLLDVSIIHLRKTELFTTVIPSKLFECMGMGIPVAHGVEGESADIVNAGGIGLTFEPENATALVNVLEQFRTDETLYQKCRVCCLQNAPHYDRDSLADRMLSILLQLTNGARSSDQAKPSTLT